MIFAVVMVVLIGLALLMAAMHVRPQPVRYTGFSTSGIIYLVIMVLGNVIYMVAN
jgi:hypothetical protein